MNRSNLIHEKASGFHGGPSLLGMDFFQVRSETFVHGWPFWCVAFSDGEFSKGSFSSLLTWSIGKKFPGGEGKSSFSNFGYES